MIIGIDGSRAFQQDRTGTENYSFQLLKGLAKIENEHKLDKPQADPEHSYLIYIRRSQEPGVKTQKWPDNFKFITINWPRLWTQAGLALRTFLDPLDILFIPSHTLPLIRRPGLKTLITVHDLGAEYLPGLHQLKQVAYLKLMTNYQLKTASRIISVSEATKKDIVKKIGIKSEKVDVIYEGVDKSIFKKISNDLVNDIVKKFDLEREKYFLFVGTIQPRKNLQKLIQAFNQFLNFKFQISNFKLLLVGQKGWKFGSIYNLPKELGIADKVRFLGRISDLELASLYNGALALTYPSLFEGFGLPILEAFASGCPVITSNVSSMPEIAGDAALTVDPYNEKEIAEAMLKICAESKFRNILIQKGYVRARQFNWEKTARETLQILKKLEQT